MKIFSKLPKRLFSFGCSFTNYAWSMWPEIIAYDLEIPLYNYGRSGSGNQFIANCITQANAKYKFNEDDLIIICWTNICREDRWIRGDWKTPGNLYTQEQYDQKWIKKYIDPLGLLIRDLSSIHLINNYLKSVKCQYHFLSMLDIVKSSDQWNNDVDFKSFKKLDPDSGQDLDVLDTLLGYYKNDIDQIKKSFYEVLWNNDIANKLDNEWRKFNGNFHDGHPWPTESLKYLSAVFSDHNFKKSTVDKVIDSENKIINEINNYFLNNKVRFKPLSIWGFNKKVFDRIISDYAIKKYHSPFVI